MKTNSNGRKIFGRTDGRTDGKFSDGRTEKFRTEKFQTVKFQMETFSAMDKDEQSSLLETKQSSLLGTRQSSFSETKHSSLSRTKQSSVSRAKQSSLLRTKHQPFPFFFRSLLAIRIIRKFSVQRPSKNFSVRPAVRFCSVVAGNQSHAKIFRPASVRIFFGPTGRPKIFRPSENFPSVRPADRKLPVRKFSVRPSRDFLESWPRW